MQSGNRRMRSALSAAVAGALGFGAASASAATLGTYAFMGSNETAVPTQTGLTYTSFVRTGLTAASQNSVFRTSGWPAAGPVDTTKHVSFSVAPQAGYRLTGTSISFDHQRQSTGPTTGEIRSSVDGFTAGTTYTPTTANATGNTIWDFTDFNTTTDTVTFRFYGFGGTGYLQFDNVTLSGDVQARASLQSVVDTPAPAQVIVGASNIRHRYTVTNNALTAGTITSEVLDFSNSLSGANGLSLSTPGNGTVNASNSVMRFADVDTSSAGNKGGALQLASSNAWRANGVAGANSAMHTFSDVAVLDHSNASFSDSSDLDAITLGFGDVEQGSTQSLGFNLHNLIATAGFTAGLDNDSFAETGDETNNVFSTNLATFANLAAGGSNSYNVSFDTTNLGTFTATYTLNLSDQNLSGATGGQTLTINVEGTVVPEPTGLAVLAAGLGLATLRRRAR